MASRLYFTTRPLFAHVWWVCSWLGMAALGSPTTVLLVALYVTGLILLDARQTQTRVTRFLPGRCHDALNRLLRQTPFSTRALMRLLIAAVHRFGPAGYLMLDDVVVEKAYAKKLPWAGWTYSFAKKRKVYGLHIVVLAWGSRSGRWRFPVAFRLWRPKRSCSQADYHTKLQLAEQMVKEVVAGGLGFEYLVFDSHYTAGWFTKMLDRLGVIWHGTLDPKTIVIWHGERLPVWQLGERLRLKWRPHLEVRARALRVYAPTYGELRLVVTRNRHGNLEYLASNDRQADLTTVVMRKRSRWSVETVFRDTKQFGGLEACQCWADAAMVRHVGLVLLTFVVLQLLRESPEESVGAVKERWQLAVLRQGELPPPPLRCCPPHLRATA
jgi:DDE superfamily endonuclease